MEIMAWIQSNLALTIIGAVTIIQISPIKIDPWGWAMKQIRTGLGIEELKDEVEDLKKYVQSIEDLRKDFDELRTESKHNWIDTMRSRILSFCNSCINGNKHTRDDWESVIRSIKEYEDYCRENKISNGVIEEDSKYLRELYRERMEKNDFY